MASESDIALTKYISVASKADVLFPEKAEIPKVYITYLSIGISHVNPYNYVTGSAKICIVHTW